MISKVVSYFILLLISMQATAGFISMDWKTSGDGLITVDTQTDLQWLDLTESSFMSFWDVGYELVGDGMVGLFPGFRFAAPAEVEQLLFNFGLTPPYDGTYRTETYAAANNFFSYFGTLSVEPDRYDIVVARASEEANSTTGFAITSCHSGVLVLCAGDAVNDAPATHGTAYVRELEIDLDTSAYVLSNWLVRNVPLPVRVSEPLSLSLLLPGIIAIFLFRRRKTTQYK